MPTYRLFLAVTVHSILKIILSLFPPLLGNHSAGPFDNGAQL